MLKVLDLFSGIGGFSLGLERTGGFETIAFCEIEDFPRRVLRKHWPDVPIFEDVRELNAEDLSEGPDVIVGGYPCQPFSVAGKRRGKEDDRHLWPEVLRLIQECEPSWVVCENVTGHVNMGLDEVLSDLEGEGYTCWTFIIPACGVNAVHKRDRLWIVANTGHWSGRNEQQAVEQGNSQAERSCYHSTPCGSSEMPAPVANTDSQRQQECHLPTKSEESGLNTGEDSRHGYIELPTESPVCSRDDGIPNRVARLKALGNAVVPQIPEMIGRAILSV